MEKKIYDALSMGSKFLNRLESNKLEAEVLLSYVLKKNKTEIYRSILSNIDVSSYAMYKELLKKRISGEPLCYITGNKEFYGIDIKVGKGVLIPRQETEIIVEESIKRLSSDSNDIKHVLEIGCGSGAISIAICFHCKNVYIDAVDISEEALCIARTNINNYNLSNRVNLVTGDLYTTINKENKFDLIISNPPYIPSENIKFLPIDVKKEPLIALDGGKDGISIISRIITDGKYYLKNNGLMLLEIDGDFQEKKITEIFYKNSYRNIFVKKDLAGIPRVIGGYLF
jgi:release factor glutamine methyltransferase